MVRKRKIRKYLRIWPEGYAPKHLRAENILGIMHTPVDLSWKATYADLSNEESEAILSDWRRHWWPRKRKIGREATTTELLAALNRVSTPSDRAILIEILGWRDNPRIVRELVPYVNDRSPRVRAEAAHSIANVANDVRKRFGHRADEAMGTTAIGPVLLSRLLRERTHRHQDIYLPAALGAVGYYPAIPALIESLQHPSNWLRGMAAWSLGVLDAEEAVQPLQRALAIETDSHVEGQLRAAINVIAKKRGEHGK